MENKGYSENGAGAKYVVPSSNGVAYNQSSNGKDMAPPISLKEAELNKEKEEIGDKCGCGPCKPRSLQCCAQPLIYLLCICCLVFTQSLMVAGYTNSILTTIERRYNLWSSELGVIVSSYDATCMIAVVLVSYFGDSHNRATWLGRGSIVMSLGAVLFILPFFLTPKYEVHGYSNTSQDTSAMCNGNGSEVDSSLLCDTRHNPSMMAFVLFIIAQMVIGIGTSPIYTLGPTYLYDNVKPHLYSIYSSIMYSMTALGPALGFLMGAAFLSLYVDPGDKPERLQDSDDAWVGAWWAGFIVCAGLALLVSIPLMMFPKELPGTKEIEVERETATSPTFGSSFKEFGQELRSLLSNWTWLFVSLAFVMEQSISTGFVTFIAKYFQVSYDITASNANIITGSVIIPGAFLGMITGGLLMKHLSLDGPGAARLLLIINIVPTLAVLGTLFLGCANVNVAGVNVAYTYRDHEKIAKMIEPESVADMIQAGQQDKPTYNLTSQCNIGCACSKSLYQPICGRDGKTYYSPCYAGCSVSYSQSSQPGEQNKRNFSECSCIYEDFSNTLGVAYSGKCQSGCHMFTPFLILLFIIVFVTCCGHNPVLIITLRSVDQGSRSFALGMQNVLCRVLAFIPAPIYFGRIFDSQCLVWAASCERDGACMEYNIARLPFVLFGMCLGLKGLTFIFLLLTYLSSRQTGSKKEFVLESPTTTPGPSLGTSVASSPDTEISTISVMYKDPAHKLETHL